MYRLDNLSQIIYFSNTGECFKFDRDMINNIACGSVYLQ